MKTIHVWFLDYGYDVPNDFLLYSLLKKNFNVVLSKNPDYLFFSDYNSNYLKHDCIRIHYSVEQNSPDFDLVDYELGYDHIVFSDRYIRCPYYMFANLGEKTYLYKHKDLFLPNTFNEIDIQSRGFCSYLSSNPDARSRRDAFFEFLSNYKSVTSGGKYRNNIGHRVDDKFDFISKYKFNISAENSVYPGYTTEKIYEAFVSNTIPIYIGNPMIDEEFNPDAFVDLNKFSSFEDAIDYIKLLDQDNELYIEMLNQPKILFDSSITKIDQVETFLVNIFNQPLSKARRRPFSQYSNYKARIIYYGTILALLYSRFPKILKSLIKTLFSNKIK